VAVSILLGVVWLIARPPRPSRAIEEEFDLEDPQIDVQEVDEPDLNARIVADRLANALERGWDRIVNGPRWAGLTFGDLAAILGRGADGELLHNPPLLESLAYDALGRVTSKLTLNLGLRYELETGLTERYNRIVRGFDLATPSPIAVSLAACAKDSRTTSCAALALEGWPRGYIPYRCRAMENSMSASPRLRESATRSDFGEGSAMIPSAWDRKRSVMACESDAMMKDRGTARQRKRFRTPGRPAARARHRR
jgi:hypothetical protein